MTNKSIRDYINLIENAQQGVAEGQDQEVTHNGEVIGHTWNQGREVHGEHTKSGMSWAGGNHASMAQHLKNHHDSWVKDQARKQSLKKQGVAEGSEQQFKFEYTVFTHDEMQDFRERDQLDGNGEPLVDMDIDEIVISASSVSEAYKKLQQKFPNQAVFVHGSTLVGQGVAEEQLEETTPDAVAKVEQLFRHK